MKKIKRNLSLMFICAFFASLPVMVSANAAEFIAHPFLEFGIEGFLSAHAELVDIDGDNDLDIVVANGRHWPQANMIYLNDGGGRMTESYRLGDVNRASYIIRAGDLDNDGDADLAVLGDNLPIEIYINAGSGKFDAPTYLPDSKSFARGAVLADINNDKFPDLIMVPRRGESKAYLGDGKGSFKSSIVLPVPVIGATGVYADDLDMDGDVDLVVALRDEQSSVVLMNNDGRFEKRELPNSIGDHRQALVGQFTNDDYKDVILANIDGGILLFKGLKDGFFEQPVPVAGTEISARSLAKGDLDQDGDLDIIVGGDEQSNIALYNKGNELFEAVELSKEADDTYGVELGDLNGDELLDIVFSNSESANVILLNRH